MGWKRSWGLVIFLRGVRRVQVLFRGGARCRGGKRFGGEFLWVDRGRRRGSMKGRGGEGRLHYYIGHRGCRSQNCIERGRRDCR